MGNSPASLAIRLRMIPGGVGYAVQRGEAIAHKNGYQLIQRDIYLFRMSPHNIYIYNSLELGVDKINALMNSSRHLLEKS